MLILIIWQSRKAEDEEKQRKFSEKARALYQGQEQDKKARSIRVIEPPVKPRAKVAPPVRYGATSVSSTGYSRTNQASKIVWHCSF